MNVRKNIDYTTMYAKVEEAMCQESSMMVRYFAIGKAVAERPEKGAAVAVAEYIQKKWPDEKGYSPRNLRRMRELYRVYGDSPEAISLAEQIGWIQNVVILEAELNLELRMWYIVPIHRYFETNMRRCFTGRGKRALNVYLPMPRRNMPCDIHTTEVWPQLRDGSG